MKVGLVRHFQVKRGFPENVLLTPSQFNQWVDEYELSDIEDGEIDMCGIEWEMCFASDSIRAVKTAEKIYGANIIQMKDLREVRPYPLLKLNIRLPFIVWIVLVRLAWLVSHKSQLETFSDFKCRVNAVLDNILSENNNNILIVSHGAIMIYMRKELFKRGFKGPKFKTPANGKLYVYER